MRALGDEGRRLEASGQHEAALALYNRGVEADELVEMFYQGAMRCMATPGRSREAVTVYRRLSRILAESLGVRPGQETQKLLAALSER